MGHIKWGDAPGGFSGSDFSAHLETFTFGEVCANYNKLTYITVSPGEECQQPLLTRNIFFVYVCVCVCVCVHAATSCSLSVALMFVCIVNAET